MRLQDGGEPMWGPFIYDGDETDTHKFTNVVTGETWTGPMPEGTPVECKVTIGTPATEQLVKAGDEWIIQPTP